MDTNTYIPPKDGKEISSGRVEAGINIFVQLGLVIAALVMLNIIGNKYYARLDWSRGKNVTLSPQTKSLLGSLDKPVQAIVMFATGGEAEADALQLLRE